MLIKQIDNIERILTDNIAKLFKTLLCFCNCELQSVIVTILHYLIFIIGIFIFYFIAKPKSKFKIVFLIFVLCALISYHLFNKCILSSVEYTIYNKKTFLQEILYSRNKNKELDVLINQIESKTFLAAMSLFLFLSILQDYKLFKKY